ncbi:MAG: hypothetical protein ACFE9L_21055 [Candidatus Hodarchaeota archaeon]
MKSVQWFFLFFSKKFFERKTEVLISNEMINDNLISEASKMIKTEFTPIDDVRSNKEYRQVMTGVLLI